MKMSLDQRRRWRLASLVRQHLWDRRRQQVRRWIDAAGRPGDAISRYQAAVRQLARGNALRMEAAANCLRTEIERLQGDLRYSLDCAASGLRRDLTPVPSMRELVRELEQLEQEFGSYRFDREQLTLGVCTEPITLEGLDLGPFEVRLYLRDLAAVEPYRGYSVIALDPLPASGEDRVTHPHVSDGHLCSGDGAAAIHAALASGRLCDFFLLVRSVLTTYNPESPYVAIEQWDGQPCADCGERTHEDDRLYCERCARDFCGQCAVCCRHCDEMLCFACMERCITCDEDACNGCLRACAGCDACVCPDCLDNHLCPACRERKEQHHDTQDDRPPHDEPGPSPERQAGRQEPLPSGSAGPG